MGWYYYLEDKIRFPFQAKCIVAKVVSPLLKGETVEVQGTLCITRMQGGVCRLRLGSTFRASACPASPPATPPRPPTR
jgi:Calcium binding